ncbi:UNVERIFIED_CONTAM: hypothetical protein K2H54_065720 [Gekko kuhli]
MTTAAPITMAPLTAALITYALYLPGQGQAAYQLVPEEGIGEMSLVWLDPRLRRSRTPLEEQVELEDDDFEDEEDQWGTRLMNLEKGQQAIQRNLEEVILTIPEIVVQAIQSELKAERQSEDQQ